MYIKKRQDYIVMFFNDESKIKIYCVIFDKSPYPQFVECVGRYKRPLASWMGHEASGDTADKCLVIRRHSRDPRRPPQAPNQPQ